MNSHKLELSKIDSLSAVLEQSASALNIDEQLLQNRSKEIEDHRSYFKNEFKDTFTLELGSQLDRYKAIRKTYDRSIADLGSYREEQVELEQQVADLRNYVKSSDYDKETFKQYLQIERSDINQHHRNCILLETTLYEIETEYQRVRTFIEGYLPQ